MNGNHVTTLQGRRLLGRSRFGFASVNVLAAALLILVLIGPVPSSASVAAPTNCVLGEHYIEFFGGTETPVYGAGSYMKPRNAYVSPGSVKREVVGVLRSYGGDWIEAGWYKGSSTAPRQVMRKKTVGVITPLILDYITPIDQFYRFHLVSAGSGGWSFWFNWAFRITWATGNPLFNNGFISYGEGTRENSCDSGFVREYGLDAWVYVYHPPYWVLEWQPWQGMTANDQDFYGWKPCIISNNEFKIRADGVDCFAP